MLFTNRYDKILIEKVIATTVAGGEVLTPDEVCEALSKIGADVSRRTLLHYEEAGLIPIPERGGGGRKGRFTDYPEWTAEEAFVAWRFIHGKYGEVINSPFEGMAPRMSPAAVKRFRDRYYSGRNEDSRTYEDAKETYLILSGQLSKDMSKYYPEIEEDLDDSNNNSNYFRTMQIREDLVQSSMTSAKGMTKIEWGYVNLWSAERLRARALLMIKKVVI